MGIHGAKVAAVLPAAGSGRRMGATVNKIWLPLAGQPILFHTLQTFVHSELIDGIVLAVNPVEFGEFEDFLEESGLSRIKEIQLVAGGNSRQESVAQGVEFLRKWPGWADARERLVAVHDAARPLLTTAMMEAVIRDGMTYQAAGIGVPVKDTIKIVDSEGFIIETPERSRVWAIQTPQVFKMDLLLECYQKVRGMEERFSDDCGIAEYCGVRVRMTPGSYENIKITTPEDLILAEAILVKNS